MKCRIILGYGLAWGLVGIVMGILTPLAHTTPGDTLDQAMLAAFLLGGAIAGVIIPGLASKGKQIIGIEVGRGLILWIGWITIGLGLNFWAGNRIIYPLDRWNTLLIILSFLAGLFSYGSIQFIRWMWPRWMSLRETRFLWSLTNSHLIVAAALVFVLELLGILGAVLSGRVSVLPLLASPGIPMPLGPLLQIVAWLGNLAVLLGISFVIVLPSSALFSFWVTRRQTRRLESLAQATRQLQGGDFSACVSVEGRDELAQLQINFNQMSARLKQTLESLQIERDKVQALLQIQHNLTANISHDLRTPLTLLRGSLETDLDQMQTELPNEAVKNMRIMLHQVERLESLVDDLFTLSQVKTNELSIHLKIIDSAEIVQRVVDAAAPLAWQMKRVKVYAEIPSQASAVFADAGRLEQVLHNLMQNGIHHTGPGGFVAVGVSDDSNGLRFDVIDSGEGIPAHDLTLIWERYYRGDSNTVGGSGLGLAIVKELVTAMGGRVEAESAVGEGSRFSIFLPRAE